MGAGFSVNAGLPLQSDFTAALLKAQTFKKGPSKAIVAFLCQFASNIFGLTNPESSDDWPELEDLFTVIDLSANTGHHLGLSYPPSKLRTVRRALIVRTIRMLSQHYGKAKQQNREDWQMLQSFFGHLDVDRTGFVSLNWDTVIEQQLLRLDDELHFEYGCDAIAGAFRAGESTVQPRQSKNAIRRVPVLKLHGSTNWLYCDNCRRLYWFRPSQNITVSNQLLGKRDWRYIDSGNRVKTKKYRCRFCRAYLGTRIATFSYTKALDFPMFQKSWFSAEALLMNARRWVFFGYSLPAADYEFKYLLKRCERARQTAPEILVITAGDAASSTIERFHKFFGKHLVSDITLKPGSKASQIRKWLSDL
jgi:hypothetical protein